MASRETDIERVIHGTLLGEAALSAEGVAALLANDDGQYIAVNDEAVHLTGYTRSNLTSAWMGFLSGDEHQRTLFQDIRRRQKLQGKKLVQRNDGEAVPCRYWAIPTRVTGIQYFLLLLWPSSSALTGV
jgi:PAS domain S-box-containing protein